MNGRLEIIDAGEVFRCRCGTVKDGATVGPKGGRQWAWRVSPDLRVCSRKCPAIVEAQDDAANDEARGVWEAQQAMEKYG